MRASCTPVAHSAAGQVVVPAELPGQGAQLGDGHAVRVLGRDAVAGHARPAGDGSASAREPRQHLLGGRHAQDVRTTGSSARPRMTNSGRRRAGRPELERRRPVEQRAERGLQLDPGQRRPDAEVHAGAEGDVRVVGAADVEGVRRRRTPPGRGWRAQQRGDLLPRGDGDPADLDVLGGGALEQLQRGVEAHQLLDRRRQQGRVVAQPLQLVGVLEQREQPVAADVDRRLVAGVEQQDAGGDQLVLGQPVALGVAHLHQVGEQVLARGACGARRPASRR